MNMELCNQILSAKKPSSLLSEVKKKALLCVVVGFMVVTHQIAGLAMVLLMTAFGQPDRFVVAMALLVPVMIGTLFANDIKFWKG